MASGNLLERYKGLIKKLWPKGRVWEDLFQSTVGEQISSALAKEPCRVAERGQDLITELDPLTADELLEDWEALLGLPDACTPDDLLIGERRQQARAKLADQGGQSALFFEEIADELGFPDTNIYDYRQFKVGKSVAGDPLTNDFSIPFEVGKSVVGEVLLNEGWLFFFEVNSPADVIESFEVGNNVVGDPLVTFGNELLECTIQQLKPAHTAAFFTFS